LELQNGQLKETSSFGRTFLGGGLDDFRLPICQQCHGLT
jgi:hypothetical protein